MGWRGAARVDEWFETNPGDNLPPKVKNVAYLTYDSEYFYAAFEFSDPDPGKIKAPLGDHDNVPGYTDYGGVILDTRNDGRTGLLLLSNPRGVQYDAVSDDATGSEDNSPDFFWNSAARITKDGWVLEMAVPFSSLRYKKADPQTWGILLYRNWPREFHCQMFSCRIPRGSNCFICNENKMSGLEGLPSGGHLVVAPYVTGQQLGAPRDGLGTEFERGSLEMHGGGDAKWTPNADTAIDGTIRPDFSQVESDVQQIAVNERFALFYPEKRPFFLEGLELFSTPIQAVYTRTITSPRWGARATGKAAGSGYTFFLTQDRGGGSVLLPGPNSSDFANQDFRSVAAMGRVRHDLGRSFVSVLGTDREIQGGGHNRVFGPDFQWRHGKNHTLTGQLLWSDSRTPNRQDLASEWTGQRLASHALDAWYSHSSSRFDCFGEYTDRGRDFRADDGFVPQVGIREGSGQVSWSFHPKKGPVSRLRTFFTVDYLAETDGDLLSRRLEPGFGFDSIRSGFTQLRLAFESVRADGFSSGGLTVPTRHLPLTRLKFTTQWSPSRVLAQIGMSGFVGEDADFANVRVGHGALVRTFATLRPTDRVNLGINADRKWLNVDAENGRSGRLFAADVGRVRGTYTFTARSFLRLIGQYVHTDRDPSLYVRSASPKSGSFSSSGLLAYKLNWQTVLFVGYGDNRALGDGDSYERASSQFFTKLSYAFQR